MILMAVEDYEAPSRYSPMRRLPDGLQVCLPRKLCP